MKLLKHLLFASVLISLLSAFFLVDSNVYGASSMVYTNPTVNEYSKLENLSTNGVIRTLVQVENTIYFGGTFTEVRIGENSPIARENIAAYDITTKQLTTWNPGANNTVEIIVVDDSTVYIGGHFTEIVNKQRSYIATFELSNGMITPWAPSLNGVVYGLAVDESKLYVGGAFTQVNGGRRTHFAAFKKPNGDLDELSFSINNTVTAVAVNDKYIYLGGAFTVINNEPYTYLSAIDKTTNALREWKPALKGLVRTIYLDETSRQVIAHGYYVENNNRIIFVAIFNEEVGEMIDYQSYVIEGTILTTGAPTNDSGMISLSTSSALLLNDTIQLATTAAVITPTQGEPLESSTSGLMVDANKLGFKIPSLADILGFVLRIFFVIAGLAALIYMLLGAFAWITSGGDKDAITAAREKIQAALIGMIMIVVVLALIWTLETLVFQRRVCLGLSCPVIIPSLLEAPNE